MADKKKAAVESAAPPPIRRRPWRPPWPRSRRPTARVPSCAWATTPTSWWRPSPPAPCPWIWPWASAASPGRIIEIYGPESSGKTTLALHIVAEAQKRGGEVAFIDAEHALDPYYARAWGWTSTPC